MKIVYNKIMYDVIASVGDEKKSYFVIDKFGKLFLTSKDIDQIVGSPISHKYDELGNFYELDYLDNIAVYKIWGKDFVDKDEKVKYTNMENEVYNDYSKFLRKEIKKDYYKDKIIKKELEIWKNNFKNEVYKIEQNKFYINDDEFDIFYEINDKNKFKFEFIDK